MKTANQCHVKKSIRLKCVHMFFKTGFEVCSLVLVNCISFNQLVKHGCYFGQHLFSLIFFNGGTQFSNRTPG